MLMRLNGKCRVENLALRLTAEDVLRGQGIDPGRASTRLVEQARAAATEAQALVHPAALHRVLEVTGGGTAHVAYPGGRFQGELVGRAMAGAQCLQVALCTIGLSLEERVHALIRRDVAAGLALDGAGTAALRLVAQAVEAIIAEEAHARGRTLGMRVFPGQEGWPIEQQRHVFALLPAEEIGVRLTDSYLMLPTKSVSFVVPERAETKPEERPCDLCSKRFRCAWRRQGSTGEACPEGDTAAQRHG